MSTRKLSLKDRTRTAFSAAPLPEDSDGLLLQANQLLHVLQSEYGRETPSSHQAQAVITQLRETIRERDRELEETRAHSAALAQAQAEALVRSAEIIEELEQTKQRLSEAQSAAEHATRETRRLADTIFERTHDGVLLLKNDICIACNDKALNLLGGSRASLIGQRPHVFDAAELETGEPAVPVLRKLFAETDAESNLDEVRSLEVRLPQREGSPFWIELTVSSFRMHEAGHFLVVARDISSRKQFEAELRRHRDFLNNIINAVPDQLAVTTMTAELVLANEAFFHAHGADLAALVGPTAGDMSRSGMLRAVDEAVRDTDADAPGGTTEHHVTYPDQTQRTLSLNHSIFSDPCSGEQYMVAAARDITDKKLREERLRLLAGVFNNASEGVAILDLAGQISEANPSLLSMLSPQPAAGRHRGSNCPPEVVGRQLQELVRLESESFSEVIEQVLSGTPWSGKGFRRSRQASRSYWVSLSRSLESTSSSQQIIALISDITELENTQRKLLHQALYDNLTGLPNRRMFRQRLDELVTDAADNGLGIAVCFIDLDDFKHVNDSAGHEKGDQLLQAVSHRISDGLPPSALVARFGGDEFAVILAGQSRTDVRSVLSRLIDSFNEPFSLGDTEACIGLSIGVTLYGEHVNNSEGLMCSADIAMYAAKMGGKNRVRFYDPQMQADVDMRHHVQSSLRTALTAGELSLAFQPKICAVTRRPVGCEALVRWQRPNGEYVPPGDFIPIAEQTGLIGPLGMKVFGLAADQASQWHRDGLPPFVAVNVSAHQLRHPRFIAQLLATLEQTGSKAHWFELEITEHAMMADANHASSVIAELRSLGFRIAIDDFGTGYSSLSYLKDFQIDTIKIDLSFVRDMLLSRQSDAVIRSIIALGKGLELGVVAEGIESQQQADLLAAAGCTLLQGYYFAKPMTNTAYRRWLEEQSVVRT